jgi:hypothetical protein
MLFRRFQAQLEHFPIALRYFRYPAAEVNRPVS